MTTKLCCVLYLPGNRELHLIYCTVPRTASAGSRVFTPTSCISPTSTFQSDRLCMDPLTAPVTAKKKSASFSFLNLFLCFTLLLCFQPELAQSHSLWLYELFTPWKSTRSWSSFLISVVSVMFQAAYRTKWLGVHQKLGTVSCERGATRQKTWKLFWSSNHNFIDIHRGVKTRHWGHRGGGRRLSFWGSAIKARAADVSVNMLAGQQWFYTSDSELSKQPVNL